MKMLRNSSYHVVRDQKGGRLDGEVHKNMKRAHHVSKKYVESIFPQQIS